jgi:hypothetical protein
MDGICTKLKYQSKPIHITPDATCNHRITKLPQAWLNWMGLPVIEVVTNKTMTSNTKPASNVL